MILCGARVAMSPDRAEPADIAVGYGRVAAIGRVPGRRRIDCGGYLILPGLVNAHDHLDFDLFPRLGDGPWESAAEWACDIHRRFEERIGEILAIPLRDRLIWGGLRNLLSGVTTVCHHNPSHRVFGERFPVRVVRAFAWAHSLHFTRDLQHRHQCCPSSRPFVFHAGEAVNGVGAREMETLARLGLFAANSVMVHAVGMNSEMLSLAQARGCSLVWCPSSNLFILGRTLSREVLESDLPVALGTDSTLTAEGDMFDELHVARKVSGLSDARLYRMVTAVPARVLRLEHGEGAIQRGGVADFLLFRDRGLTPARTLLSDMPEAVFVGGRPQMLSADLLAAWSSALPQLARFHPLTITGRGARYVHSEIPPLPAGFSVGGRQVLS